MMKRSLLVRHALITALVCVKVKDTVYKDKAAHVAVKALKKDWA
jgi:hypothetical protein